MQNAIGEKVATFIMTIFMCIAGFVVGFTRGWKLSLVILSTMPVVMLAGFLFSFFLG